MMENHKRARELRLGVLLGLLAYLWWGILMPVYIKAVSPAGMWEVLCHRILWSMVLLVAIMTATRRWSEFLPKIKNAKVLALLVASTFCIASNWLGFIYAIGSGRLVEASLGYYINPLVSVLLGFLFLKERLRLWQSVSVFLAVAGVLFMLVDFGRLPAIAIWVALSFGFYGLIRKVVAVNSIEGLCFETLLLSPFALGYVIAAFVGGTSDWMTGNASMTLLLMCAGVITAVPLLWFAGAARRLRLSTIGFLQYLTPTLQLVCAVIFFGESFGQIPLPTFVLIWVGLMIYSVDSVFASRA